MQIGPLDLFEVAAFSRGGLAGLARVRGITEPDAEENGCSAKSGAGKPYSAAEDDAVIAFLRYADAYSGSMSRRTYEALGRFALLYGQTADPTLEGIEAALYFLKMRLPRDTVARRATSNIEMAIERARRWRSPMAQCICAHNLGQWLHHAKRWELAPVIICYLMGSVFKGGDQAVMDFTDDMPTEHAPAQ